MCLFCVRCGNCPGVEPAPEVKALYSKQPPCLMCKAEIPKGATECPNCGHKVFSPPGVI